ncbi:MAG: OsmC family protein [Flavobacteriaceae bacterium]|nr:OsmC family protein [Flavobacteriaceae bacterium]
MKIELTHQSDYHATITDNRGYTIDIDNKSVDNPKGASPMELLLMGLAGCSSIDIVHILDKQKIKPDSLKIEVHGNRQVDATPALFTDIHATVKVTGDVKPDRIYRAAKLSFEKYCSVSKTLEATAKITFSVIVNDAFYESKK